MKLIQIPIMGYTESSLSGINGDATIENNKFNYCGRNNTGGHRLGVIDGYANVNNMKIIGNTATNTMAFRSFERWN